MNSNSRFIHFVDTKRINGRFEEERKKKDEEMNAKEHLTGVMVEFEGVIGEGAGRARGGRAASCGNEEAIGGCGSQVVDTDVI